MKKSTILILVIVFLGSVLIVGIFGMQAVPYEQIVYIDEIVPSGIVTSTGETPEIKRNSRGEWYVVIQHFEEGMSIMLSYDLKPADCTNKSLKVVIAEPQDNFPCDPLPEDLSQWRGELVFHRKGTVRIRYSARDSATGAVMDLVIYFA